MFDDASDLDIRGFECCFCKKAIEETRNDPVDINIVLNENMLQKNDTSQSFYAHAQCLYERLHESVRGYFLRKREKIHSNG